MGAQPKQAAVTQLPNQYTKVRSLEAHRQKKRERRLKQRLGFILLIGTVIVILLAAQLINSKRRAAELEELTEQTQTERAEVMEHQEELEYDGGRLEDDNYIAKLARNEYYLSEDDELIFTFPQDTRPSFSYKRGVEKAEDDEEALQKKSDRR